MDADTYARWRALGATIKARHIARLLADAGIAAPRSVLEVGCGDGAVLSELARREIGETRMGLDISSAAVRLAAQRPEVTEASTFDGRRVERPDRAYDLVFATHVLEHVAAPEPLLREMARVAGKALVVEVPLERNLSRIRRASRERSQAAGHLHQLTRQDVRRMIDAIGWQTRAELLDPLPLAVHAFWASGAAGRGRGVVKWAARKGLAVVPAVGERVMTLHYAVLAVPR